MRKLHPDAGDMVGAETDAGKPGGNHESWPAAAPADAALWSCRICGLFWISLQPAGSHPCDLHIHGPFSQLMRCLAHHSMTRRDALKVIIRQLVAYRL